MRPTSFNQLKECFMILLWFVIVYAVHDLLTKLVQRSQSLNIELQSDFFNLTLDVNTTNNTNSSLN